MESSPRSAAPQVTDRSGVYALVLELQQELEVTIGRERGALPPGIYVYIGSARGPGGVRARVLRHLRREKKVKWHIDQLTAAARALGIVFAETRERECVLTPHLENIGFAHPLPGFGSSDCTSGCRSHLLWKPAGEDVLARVEEAFRRAGLNPVMILL
ncbi:MAG: GIY-YIG nuclease family protein [Thermofilum sp.]